MIRRYVLVRSPSRKPDSATTEAEVIERELLYEVVLSGMAHSVGVRPMHKSHGCGQQLSFIGLSFVGLLTYFRYTAFVLHMTVHGRSSLSALAWLFKCIGVAV